MESINTFSHREPWNEGKLVGPKAPFKLKEILAIRNRLQMAGHTVRDSHSPWYNYRGQVSVRTLLRNLW